MRVFGHVESLGGSCGVGLLYGFYARLTESSWGQSLKDELKENGGGIGYNIAGFINNDVCRQMYEQLREEYEIVFQSPVKVNQNSGNRFFFIVFKFKE